MERFTIQPVATWWILIAIVGVLAAALLAGPGFARLTVQQNRRLFLIRLGLIALAVIALLRPGIVSTVQQKQSAVLAIMLDYSRSMKLSHRSTGPNRWGAMTGMIRDNQERLAALRDQNIDVRFFAFGNRLKPLELTDGLPTFPEEPLDSESDLGTAIYSVIDSVRDQRLLGIVMASDGVQNAPDPEIELAQAAKLLEDTQTALVAVPFGQAAQTDQFADIAIENMADQFTCWVKNNLTVSATIQARGFANQEVPVQLIVIGGDGQEQVVDTVRQSFTQASESAAVELTYTPQEPGQYQLIVRAEPQAGEVSPRNNELPGFLTVNEGGLKVLYVYGSLNWEVSFLIRSLGQYQDIQLDQLHMDRRQESRWPLDKTELFNDDSYDVFILHNVDSRALYRRGTGEGNLQALADAVINKGKGLIMIGGYQSFGAGLYRLTPLADVLPIEMDFDEKQDFDEPIREDLHNPNLLRAIPREGHFITQLGDPEENEAIWERLPAFVGANRFVGLKDTAGVILAGTGGEPILVGYRNGGRVLAMAADTTYLWWTHGMAEAHKRFWRQIVLWLAFKDSMSGENVRIELAQRRFKPNTPIRFTAEAETESNQQIDDAQFSGVLVDPAGERNTLAVVNGGPSQIDRRLLESPGIYTIEVAARRNGKDLGRAEARFVVFDNDKEQANPAADPDQLNRLAERTAEYGGRSVDPPSLPSVLDDLATLAPQLNIDVPMKWQLGDTFPDALVFVLLFAGLLTYEWWLRKKWGLV